MYQLILRGVKKKDVIIDAILYDFVQLNSDFMYFTLID